MKLETKTVRFEFNDDVVVELDVLRAKMDIEKIQEESGEDANAVLDGVNDLFEDAGVILSTSQAWQVIHAVEAAYDSVKKKLSDTLESDFGTVPILLTSRNGLSSGSTGSFPSSSQSESCTNETATANSPEQE